MPACWQWKAAMFLNAIVIGAIFGAIAWPLIERTKGAMTRVLIGAMLGAFAGAGLAWAGLGRAGGNVLFGITAEELVLASGADFTRTLLHLADGAWKGAALLAILLLTIIAPARVVLGAIMGSILGAGLFQAMSYARDHLITTPISEIGLLGLVVLTLVLFFGVIASLK